MTTKKALIAASALCWALLAGSALADQTANKSGSDQPVADSVITTKVKAELTKDKATKAHNIHVKTTDGIVTLSGSVDSTTEKQQAEQDARTVKGVLNVDNQLNVKQ